MKSIIPKIGKRGWLGVVLFAIGAYTFLGARSGADSLYQNTDEVNYAESLSKEAGYSMLIRAKSFSLYSH